MEKGRRCWELNPGVLWRVEPRLRPQGDSRATRMTPGHKENYPWHCRRRVVVFQLLVMPVPRGSTLVNYRAMIPPGFPKSRKRDLLSILTVAGSPKAALTSAITEYYGPIVCDKQDGKRSLKGEEWGKKP